MNDPTASIAVTRTEQATPSVRRPKRSGVWVVLAGVALFALSLALGWWLSPWVFR